MKGSIELDCRPGPVRPGDLIESVVKGTALDGKLLSNNPNMMLMGNWTWEFELTEEEYASIRFTIKERITILFASGLIRYGSW